MPKGVPNNSTKLSTTYLEL